MQRILENVVQLLHLEAMKSSDILKDVELVISTFSLSVT